MIIFIFFLVMALLFFRSSRRFPGVIGLVVILMYTDMTAVMVVFMMNVTIVDISVFVSDVACMVTLRHLAATIVVDNLDVKGRVAAMVRYCCMLYPQGVFWLIL